jgi:glycosyltransferase involved in cell wall biosynthesis
VDVVITNGIEREALATRPRVLRTAGGGPSSLVTVGRAWDEAKGHAVVDEALELVSEAWTGYLAGELEGPAGQTVRPRRLKALGRLPLRDVRQLLGRSNLYVGASLYEPFGLAPVEAAMAGCALVLSDIGSFRELWGPDALYFPPGDAAGLARVLDGLRRDGSLHHDLRLRALRRAWARFDDRQMTARYIRLYEALLRRRRRRGPQPAEGTVAS